MTLKIIRIFFIIVSTIVGYQIGSFFNAPYGGTWAWPAAAVGFLGSGIIILLEFTTRKISVRGLSSAVFGLIFGLLISKIITNAFLLIPMDQTLHYSLQLITTLIFCYFGMMIAIRGRDEFNLVIPYVKFTRQDQKENLIILDTSVIIDGRIADIVKTKFIEGRFVIPRFVLRELQQIADSQDPLKRNRGRRGLDILHRIQKDSKILLKIHEEDFPDIADVDAKIVKLAEVLGAQVFTNDYNLNKIAELQGVTVLNLNELANTLKPVVLPGELLEARLIKEGKEYNQAVAYLDDGTMVVVENARHLIGKTLHVLVTSVLQTAAGRMIFAKLQESKR